MKTKNPTTDRFPREYWDIVEVVGEQEQILRIPFSTKAATHKHEVTGESLVDNVRDALRDLAKAKADLAAARAGGTR